MKDIILKLISDKPKHYTSMIKNNPEMAFWVERNAVTFTEHWPSKIWSAVHQEDLICSNGGKKQVENWNYGLKGCGPAKTCACTRESISQNVKKSKSEWSDEKHQHANQRRKDTMVEKYGVAYNSQRDDVKHIWTKPKVSDEALLKLADPEWCTEEYITKQRSTVDIADELGVYYSTVAAYCISHGLTIRRRSSYSMTELQIKNYLENDLGITDVIHSDWSVLGDRELDLYIPSKNIAIEVNGLYWHSHNPSNGKVENIDRHLEKTLNAAANNVDLIHITDWEWINRQDIIKSILAVKLGKSSTKIYARKCDIKQLTSKEANQFFTSNHLQGFISASHYVGLLDKSGEIVLAISIGKNRYNKSRNGNTMELYRLASKLNVIVTGGASKLIKHAMKVYNITKLISYCDRSKSNGNGYRTMGFTELNTSKPGYLWTDGTEIVSRHRVTRTKIPTLLGTKYDSTLSESENMFNAGYRRYWDCGNYVFELSLK